MTPEVIVEYIQSHIDLPLAYFGIATNNSVIEAQNVTVVNVYDDMDKSVLIVEYIGENDPVTSTIYRVLIDLDTIENVKVSVYESYKIANYALDAKPVKAFYKWLSKYVDGPE